MRRALLGTPTADVLSAPGPQASARAIGSPTGHDPRHASSLRRVARAKVCQSLPSGSARGSTPRKGDGAPKSANLWFRASLRKHGGRLSARQSQRLYGPCFSPPASPRIACRGVSQFLAGTPSGPGGSSGTARELVLRTCARRRRTSSRSPRRLARTPLNGRGDANVREVRGPGITHDYFHLSSPGLTRQSSNSCRAQSRRSVVTGCPLAWA